MVVPVLLLAPCFLDDLRIALHHQSVPCLVLLLLLQQVGVACLQDLAQLGEIGLADGFAGSELSLLFSFAGTVSEGLVGVVLGVVAIVGLGQLVGEVVQVFGDPDGAHQLLFYFLALSDIEI